MAVVMLAATMAASLEATAVATEAVLLAALEVAAAVIAAALRQVGKVAMLPAVVIGEPVAVLLTGASWRSRLAGWAT